jgi:HNH endonuclease
MPAKNTGKNQGKNCSVDGCTDLAFCRGWCAMHYQRWRHGGDPLVVKQSQARKGKGFKYRKVDGKVLLAHQIAYIENHGNIPINEKGELLHIHHKDGDHSNNSPENLVALHRNEHTHAHWPKGHCQVEGCNSRSANKGLCSWPPGSDDLYCPAHYYQLKKFGKITNAVLKWGGRKKKWLVCSVEGCGSEGYSLGYCVRHYYQMREHGEVKHVEKVIGGTKKWITCKVEGCVPTSMKGACQGYCDRHYQQIRKFGRIVSVGPIDQSEVNRRGWETRRLKTSIDKE